MLKKFVGIFFIVGLFFDVSYGMKHRRTEHENEGPSAKRRKKGPVDKGSISYILNHSPKEVLRESDCVYWRRKPKGLIVKFMEFKHGPDVPKKSVYANFEIGPNRFKCPCGAIKTLSGLMTHIYRIRRKFRKKEQDEEFIFECFDEEKPCDDIRTATKIYMKFEHSDKTPEYSMYANFEIGKDEFICREKGCHKKFGFKEFRAHLYKTGHMHCKK